MPQAIGDQGLKNLIQDVRILADNSTAQTVKPVFNDEVLTRMIQRASNKLYYDLVKTGVVYFADKQEFSLSDSDEFYRLPDAFYKPLVLLFKQTNDVYYLVPNGELRDQDDGYKTASGYGSGYGSYIAGSHQTKKHLIIDRSTGSELHIIPEKDKAGDYLLEYIPDSPDVQSLRVPRGWADYLLYGATLELGVADYNTRQEWAHILQALIKQRNI